MRIITLALTFCLLALPALGVAPLQVPLQGVIRDNAGVPVVEDVFEVTFSLYDAVDAVDPVWSETWPPAGANCVDDPSACVHVVNGRFRLALGAHNPLGPELFVASNGLWLGMKVETDPELDRRPLGSAPYALHAATAASASSLDCTGCIPPEALSNEAVLDILDTTLLAVQNAGYVHEGDLNAGTVPYDGVGSELTASDVQGAIDELKALIEEKTGAGAGGVNEGAGQVIVYEQDQAISAYGTIRRYVHLVNPATPKVMAYLYGDQASSTGGSDNLVVAYDFAPNEYSAGVIGTGGETSVQVQNPSIFSTGSHILLHQTVGGGAYEAATWELAKVVAVNGNTLQLVQPLEHSYGSDDTAKAQAVVGASFGHLEVVSGGKVRPSQPLAADGSSGGIVYIRANKITVRSGGVIHADALGAFGGQGGAPAVGSTLPGAGQFSPVTCGGSGGGSNAEEGLPGDGCGSPGQPGETQGEGSSPLTFGGAGAPAAWGLEAVYPGGGAGGGIVVLGGQQVVVQEGGRVSANGAPGPGPGSGGGAGGTVAIFAEDTVFDGDLEAPGGPGGAAPDGSDTVVAAAGWDYIENPTQTHTKSMDTHSHGGGYSPYHQEFWYPQWSGSTVYRHDRNTGNQIGSFSSGQDSIMQIWGELDGSYYTANWGNDRVYRWVGEQDFNGEVWEQYLGSTAAGVCSDGQYVYAVRHSDGSGQIERFDPKTGANQGSITRSGGEFGGLYSMVCIPGRVITIRESGAHGYVYDSSNGQLIDDFAMNVNAGNTSFDGEILWVAPNNNDMRGYRLVTSNIYIPGSDTGAGGSGGSGYVYTIDTVAGIVNESFPKDVQIWIDGNNVTAGAGDPNGKGPDSYNVQSATWGASGLAPWSTGPLDVTNLANWTLGEHVLELKETGGAGGQLKSYIYVIYPFTESTPPPNDTCTSPIALDPNSEPVVISGTTEDIMGKTLATDASVEPGCGGQGGPDVVYRIDLAQRSLLHAAVVAPFPTRLYLRAGSCVSGSQVYCSDGEFTTNPIEAGTYFLFVDSNAPIAKGDFTLAVSTTPAALPTNDTCEAAEDLVFTDGVATVNASSIYALNQYDGFCAPPGDGPDVVYHFVTDQTYSVAVDFQADFAATTYLVSGACSGAGSFPSLCNQQGIPSQFLPAGEYWLVVDGNGEKVWGDYSMTVTLQ